MHWHFVILAALFYGVSASGARHCDSNRRLLSLIKYCARTGEAVKHRGNERPVP